MKEAVLFLFYRDHKVLLEKRMNWYSLPYVYLIPGGGIDEIDHTGVQDYKAEAMLREIREEFNGKVLVKSYHPLGKFIEETRRNMFHAFLITHWEGVHPQYIEDTGAKDELFWFPIDEAIGIATQKMGKEVITAAGKFLEKQ